MLRFFQLWANFTFQHALAQKNARNCPTGSSLAYIKDEDDFLAFKELFKVRYLFLELFGHPSQSPRTYLKSESENFGL
jgi:hypothetical protein